MAEEGLKFERELNEEIKKLGITTYFDKEIVKKFGDYAQGIDIIGIYNDKHVYIQTKREEKKGNLKDIHHFLFGCLMIKNDLKPNDIKMIWSCKSEPNKSSIKSLEKMNCINICEPNCDIQKTQIMQLLCEFFGINQNNLNTNNITLTKNSYDQNKEKISNYEKVIDNLYIELKNTANILLSGCDSVDLNNLNKDINNKDVKKIYKSFCKLFDKYNSSGYQLSVNSSHFINLLNGIVKHTNEIIILNGNKKHKQLDMFNNMDDFKLFRSRELGKIGGIHGSFMNSEKYFNKVKSTEDVNKYVQILKNENCIRKFL